MLTSTSEPVAAVQSVRLTRSVLAFHLCSHHVPRWLFEAELGFKALSAPPEYPNQDQAEAEGQFTSSHFTATQDLLYFIPRV